MASRSEQLLSEFEAAKALKEQVRVEVPLDILRANHRAEKI